MGRPIWYHILPGILKKVVGFQIGQQCVITVSIGDKMRDTFVFNSSFQNLKSDIEAIQQLRRVGRQPDYNLLGTFKVNYQVVKSLIACASEQQIEELETISKMIVTLEIL